MTKKKINQINATFDGNRHYRLSNDGYVDTNATEEDIIGLEKRFDMKLPRESTKIPWKEKDCKYLDFK